MIRVFFLSLFLFYLYGISPVLAAEIKGKQATIFYEDEADLKRFVKGSRFGSFSFFFGGKKGVTMEQEAANNMDKVLTRVQEILEMFPKGMQINVSLHKSSKQLSAIHKEIYWVPADYIAFYARKRNTVYIATKEMDLRVLAHELAHAVIEHYFNNSPPVKLHELMAQYVESQIENY